MSTTSMLTFQERILMPFTKFFRFPFPHFCCYIYFYSLRSKFLVLGEETSDACPHLDLPPTRHRRRLLSPPSGETTWLVRAVGCESEEATPGPRYIIVGVSTSLSKEATCCGRCGHGRAESPYGEWWSWRVPRACRGLGLPKKYNFIMLSHWRVGVVNCHGPMVLKVWHPRSSSITWSLFVSGTTRPYWIRHPGICAWTIVPGGGGAGWHLKTTALAHSGSRSSPLQISSWQSGSPQVSPINETQGIV